MQWNALFRNQWLRVSMLIPVSGFTLFLLLNVFFPLRVRIPYAQITTARDGAMLYAFLSRDDKWRMKTELPEIIPELRQIIIYKEDKYFYYHPGVNPAAIARAAWNNLIHGRKTSGASTITMQVARLLAPKDRTYANKFVEMFRALQLEWQFSKDEILQLYLNLVPYGGNVEGVKAAAWLYFGRMPNQLSVAQIAALSIIPNRPTSLALGRNDDVLIRERNRWLTRFRAAKLFDDEVIADAVAEPLNARRVPLPTLTPHLAFRLKAAYPDSAIVQTTIRTATQAKVQQLASNYHHRLRRLRMHNMAVVVVENRTRDVVAYIGSPDFTDDAHAGQVDGVRAVRSPGSTLKPLVYALGIDLGKITPKTVLTDVPTDFAGYAPGNFDNTFNGNVTVERALAYSLNVPAVKVLDDVGVPAFVEKLKQANFRQIRKDERKLGLSAVLGGCGVTLEELTSLFTALANEGTYAPLRYVRPAPALPQREGEQILSPAVHSNADSGIVNVRSPGALISPSAAFMVTEILTMPIRPDLPNNYRSSYHVPKIAWKTGTSYGRRDAWSIGYNDTYTVGVWIGNASGEGVAELSGADIATPLLFQIFNAIDYNSANRWFAAPKNLKFRLVCAESGLVPGDHCAHQIADYFIPLVSGVQKCTHVREVAVAADETLAYCTSCLPENGYKKKMFPVISPELATFYESSGVAYAKMPPHNPACTRVFAQGAPVIVSPADGSEYYVDAQSPSELMLRCQTPADVEHVYWYIDDRFYCRARTNERVFFTPTVGAVKISCSDDHGRNTDIRVTVRKE